MVAGNTNVPISYDKASAYYRRVRTTQLYFTTQNAFTAPSAHQYVTNLFKAVPTAKEVVKGKLAIVTGVTIGGAGYYMAEELAVSAEMAVILMGRSAAKLEAAEAAIVQNAEKQGKPTPKLYHVLYDLDDLHSATKAAVEATKIANKDFQGKIHVLINNAGASVPAYKTTKQGVEANVGRNYLAPHVLTEGLLSGLKKAASPDYKPRVVFVASLGHCLAPDLDPSLLVSTPAEGGAPTGILTFDDNGNCTADTMVLVNCYGRAKFGSVMETVGMQKKHPEINFTSQHPGSILSNFGNDLGLMATIYYYGFYFFQFSPSQGARAALRAALDPDFNTVESLQGAYLHSDGNPWPPCRPEFKKEGSDEVMPVEEYAKALLTKTDELTKKLMA